jgi:cobalt transporter subunit CbtA
VTRLRKLVYVILTSGTLAGLLLFVLQHFTIFPLIEKAEVYESAAEKSDAHHHRDEGWRPANGVERTAFTALTTVATSIGFSALLFGIAGLVPTALDWRKGLLWGLVAFVCVDLAPSLGLPPQPPGTPVADLYARQGWWVFTVLSTAAGIWLLLNHRRSVPVRLIGVLPLILPHAIGAPVAQGESAVPVTLIHQFAVVSILTTGLFWVVLGAGGGLFYARSGYLEAQERIQ